MRDSFLWGCSGLTSVDLSSLSQVTTIGHHFLYGCSGLTSADLSSLSHVANIGIHFMGGCIGLRSVVVPKESSQILQKAVGNAWKNADLGSRSD